MKQIKLTIHPPGMSRPQTLVIEEVEGEPRIRHEDQPVMARDVSSYVGGYTLKVEKIA